MQVFDVKPIKPVVAVVNDNDDIKHWLILSSLSQNYDLEIILEQQKTSQFSSKKLF